MSTFGLRFEYRNIRIAKDSVKDFKELMKNSFVNSIYRCIAIIVISSTFGSVVYAQDACIELFTSTKDSVWIQKGIQRGAYIMLNDGSTAKVLGTPVATDTLVRVLDFSTEKEMNMPLSMIAHTRPLKVFADGEVTVDGQPIEKMKTRLFSRDLNDSYLFTGRGFDNYYGPAIEVFSAKLKTNIVIPASSAVVATPKLVLEAKIKEFKLRDIFPWYARQGFNLNGIHEFKMHGPVLTAILKGPGMAPGSDFPALWKEAMNNYRKPILMPSSIGEGYVVYFKNSWDYQHVLHFAFFKTVEEAQRFLASPLSATGKDIS